MYLEIAHVSYLFLCSFTTLSRLYMSHNVEWEVGHE